MKRLDGWFFLENLLGKKLDGVTGDCFYEEEKCVVLLEPHSVVGKQIIECNLIDTVLVMIRNKQYNEITIKLGCSLRYEKGKEHFKGINGP